jgi:hypothetical protein
LQSPPSQIFREKVASTTGSSSEGKTAFRQKPSELINFAIICECEALVQKYCKILTVIIPHPFKVKS